jgi:all-trans-8'-apo-beta-carotenal 15,15'-oxygenase
MTAHPKCDVDRGKFVGWTWVAKAGGQGSPLQSSPRLTIHEWNKNWESVNETSVTLSFTTTAPHDFSITPNFYVFVENRLYGNTLPYILGTKTPSQCLDIDPKKKMVLTLVTRPTTSMGERQNGAQFGDSRQEGEKKSFELSPGFTIHSVCAFENENEGSSNTLELYTTGWETKHVESGNLTGGLLGPWKGKVPVFDHIPITLLYRTVVSTQTGTLISHAPIKGLEKTIVEHPHINPYFEGKKVRYMWCSLGSSEGISGPPLGYMRIDL